MAQDKVFSDRGYQPRFFPKGPIVTTRTNTGSGVETTTTVGGKVQSVMRDGNDGQPHRVVVAGHPEITQEEALQIKEATKQTGPHPIIQDVAGGHQVSTSFQTYAEQRLAANQLNTTIVNPPKVVTQTGVNFSDVGPAFVKAPSVNAFSVLGQSGYVSSPVVDSRVSFGNSLVSVIYPSGEQKGVSFNDSPFVRSVSRGATKATETLIIGPFVKGPSVLGIKGKLRQGTVAGRFFDVAGGIPLVKSSNIYQNIKGIKEESPFVTASRSEVQGTALLLTTAPISGLPIVRYGFGALGIGSAVKTFKENPSIAGATEAGIYGTLGVLSIPRYNLVTRSLMKLRPDYVSLKESKLVVVEDTTIPTSLKTLQSYEGKNVYTVHATLADLPKEFVTQAQPSGAGAGRTKLQLFDFYRSAPLEGTYKATFVKGYKTSDKLISSTNMDLIQGKSQTYFLGIRSGRIVSPYVRETSKPVFYGGYVGIVGEKSTAPSSGKVVFGEPRITALIEKLRVEPNPKSKSITELHLKQVQMSGKTFIAAENIYGRSIEGQVYTVSAYGERGINQEFFGPKIYEKGNLPVPTPGSKIVTEKAGFTFYPQRKENILTQGINAISQKISGKEAINKEQPIGKLFYTTRYFKINLRTAKTSPVPGAATSSNKIEKELPFIDVNKAQKELSTARRIESPSSISSGVSSKISRSGPFSGTTYKSSEMISSKKVSSYYLTSSYPSVSVNKLSSSFVSSSKNVSSIPSNISSGSSISSPISSSEIISSTPSSSIVPSTYYYSSPSRSSYVSKIIYPSDKKSSSNLIYSKKKFGKKERKIRIGKSEVFVLPDLASVSVTEQESFRRYGGGEAAAPKLTANIYKQAVSAFKGYGSGRVQTEQLRTGVFKPRRMKI